MDNRVQASMAQLYSSLHGQGAGATYNISGEPWMTMGPLMRDVLEKPLRLSSAWSSVSMTVFRINVMRYGPNSDNYTFWPIYDCVTFPCSLDTTRYHADDPMSSWEPSWPYHDDHFPNCDYIDLGTWQAYDQTISWQCPDALGQRRHMRNLRIQGPVELLIEPFLVDGLGMLEVGMLIWSLWPGICPNLPYCF
jgi:hypothetical protein